DVEGSVDTPGATQTEIVDAVARPAPAAVGRPHDVGGEVPATATVDAPRGPVVVAWQVIVRAVLVAVDPAVLAPFPDVAKHVDEPESVGLAGVLRHGVGLAAAVLRVPAVVAVHLIAPEEAGRRAGAAGILPLGFRRQPQTTTGLLEPGLDVVPGYAFDGQILA